MRRRCRAASTPKAPGSWLMQNTELGRGWIDTGRDGMHNGFSLN
jgi:hypothetical protein